MAVKPRLEFRTMLALAGIVCVTCLLSACGSSSGSGSTSPSSSTSAASGTGHGATSAHKTGHRASSASASAHGAPPPGGTSRGASRPRVNQFFACLKSHGVALPNGAGAGFHSNPKLQAAVQACGGSHFKGPGGFGRFRRGVAKLEHFVSCVRRHGYNLPAPNFSGHGTIFSNKIKADPKFQAAASSCLSLLQSGP